MTPTEQDALRDDKTKADMVLVQHQSELLLQKAKFFSALTDVANNFANLLGAVTEKVRAENKTR